MATLVTCSAAKIFYFLFVFELLCYSFCQKSPVPEPKEEPSGYLKREYSAVKPFADGTSMQFWELFGHSMVTDEHIRLTPDQQSRSGSVWNALPVMIRDWEIHIQFKIHGQNSRFFGDGFAFWYTKDKGVAGPVFGNKDYFRGLAMFFDTYANQNGEHEHDHPYISAQVNNGTNHYDHDKDGTHTELDGCSASLRGVDHETHVAIRYLGSRKRLTVQHDMDGENRWIECFDSYGVELPTGYHLGFSAQTGDLSDNHDLLSVRFFELASNDDDDDPNKYLDIIPRAEHSAEERAHSDDEKVYTRKERAFSWFMMIVVILVLGGLVGFFYYQKHQKDQLKRFY